MTNPKHTDTSRSDDLVKECRLDAKAFRENTVYDSDGDPIRLIANAERLDHYADRIERLEAALLMIAIPRVGGGQWASEIARKVMGIGDDT